MDMFDGSIPEGLAMAFAEDTDAMAAFTALSAKERQNFIGGTNGIGSKEEMRAYAASLKK